MSLLVRTLCRSSFWKSPHKTEFYFFGATNILPCQRHRFQPLLFSSKLINFTQIHSARRFSTPTVSDMVSNPRSASKRKSAVYGLNGLRPTLRVGALHLKSSTAARSCSYGRFPWAALLCFAFGQKIWHTIFFSSKPNFKIFPKLLPKPRGASPSPKSWHDTVHLRYPARSICDCWLEKIHTQTRCCGISVLLRCCLAPRLKNCVKSMPSPNLAALGPSFSTIFNCT